MADAASALALRRPVRLLMLDEARTPMIAGVFRPVVVLPADAVKWEPAHRQLVLLHELGHAKRLDVLTQALAGFVGALHWFNPLCWHGLTQMRKLRELACDDLVLASGHQSADYADVLLDVARAYRHHSLAMTVGMARGSNIENRILAALDQARSQVALSRTTVRRSLLIVAALVMVIGSMRLSTFAEPVIEQSETADSAAVQSAGTAKGEPRDPSAADDVKATPQDAENKHRTLTVRITDEAGMPLENAGLQTSFWKVEGYKGGLESNRKFRADENGEIAFPIPRRLHILRMWPTMAGYVPEFVNFGENTRDEVTIPDRYEFRLAKGTELSGIVVDEDGRPVPGVKVSVGVRVQDSGGPEPIISTYLTANDNEPGMTDADGRWRIDSAPAAQIPDDFEFRLQFEHADFIPDRQGVLQDLQGVTTAMLRDGSAKIALRRGVRVEGTIVDASGKPVTKGLVIWSDRTYFAEGVNEAPIDETGHFKTLPLLPGEHSLTIAAPGFQPQRRIVTVDKSMDELRFELQPGKRTTLKVVDRAGQPIPKAYVGIGEWRGVEALYNEKHPNVPESHIPRHADENGIYVWDWAPEDAVSYRVSAKGYSMTTVTLVATEKEHVVTLVQPLTAAGSVTDAKTGQPVEEFRVIPVTLFRPMFWATEFDQTVSGRNGKYEIKLGHDVARNYRYQVRIEAHGYRTALSERSFGMEDGRVTVDFALEPAALREGKVIDARGNSVAGATVVLGTPSAVSHVSNNDPDFETPKVKTSVDGTFHIAATFEPTRIRVMHDTGFAEVLRQPDEEIGTLQLQPWAGVSGRLLHDEKPIPDQGIYFRTLPDRGLGEARFQDSYYAKTDAAGHFEFQRLPPIPGSLRAHLGPWQDSPLTSSQSIPLELQPGEHRTLTLGGGGLTLTGHVVATGREDMALNKNWSLNYLIRRDGGIQPPADSPALSFDPRGTVQSSWFLDPRHNDWLATRPNYFVKLAPDGRLYISGVPPGEYDLVLRLYEQPAGCLVETIGERVVPITLTQSDVAAGTKDVGVIEVECRAGPRVGENMQAYQFIDTTGRQRYVADLKGRYVLMHVWASWCAPCLEHMPVIKTTADKLVVSPITFVGLNIDDDVARARELAERGGWSWSQNYLGDQSDLARQLAISSVPTYFLIGPDGLLVASATEWTEIQRQIETALLDDRK